MKAFIFVLLAIIAMAFGDADFAKSPECLQPLRTGRCQALFYRYGYVASKMDCVKFTYGGCDGNDNNFVTKEDCLKACLPILG